MYLLSHLWWYLLLAFSLGALIGYLLWRVCSRPMIESRYERSRKDLNWRLHNLEEERANFASAGNDDGTELAKLRSELAAAKQRNGTDDAERQKLSQSLVASHEAVVKKACDDALADASRKHTAELKKARDEVTASLTTAHAGEVKKLQDTAKAHESKVLSLTQADTSARQELDAAKTRHAEDLKKTRDQLVAEWTAKHAADVKKAREDAAAEAARHHADEIRKARDQVAAEWTTKHTAELKKARDEVTASLTTAHAGEVKKLQDTAKAHESKVLSLTQADTSARQELDAAKTRHAEDLKKTRDQLVAEWTAKHAADVKKAREDAAAEAARHHADEIRKVSAASVAAASSHEAALKSTREGALADAARRHNQELAELQSDHNAALARHADDLAKARVTAATPAAVAASAVVASKTDDLKLIWGVGPEIEKLLNQHGTRSFEQIANWTGKDVSWFEGLLPAFKGRPESEKWVEQCKKLANGWRPEREIGDKPKDILTAARGGKSDDLKLIWGVGPKLEVMLNNAGFYHFDQIANWSDREIEWVDTQLGDFAGRAVRDKWVEQCKKLATGWRPSSDVGEKPK